MTESTLRNGCARPPVSVPYSDDCRRCPCCWPRPIGQSGGGFGLSETAREYRMGWRMNPAAGGGLALDLDAARRETANDDAPEHRVGLGVTARW